ncbi:unnamed protein product, partial [Anisakis simplex]|uniref:Probable tRNA pseudouridine synthase 2 (inferred by orthology to a human protein) n=1 Tax=Anisakis simplex TaxID=6269 RepID=A0A0M3J6W6_ANISI
MKIWLGFDVDASYFRLNNVFIIGKGTKALVSLPGATKGVRCAMVIKSSKLWAVLQGIVCVHKARDVSLAALKKILTSAICANANAAVRTPEQQLPLIEMPIVEPHPKSQALVITGLRKQLDYTHHPLVVGEPFRKEDIRVEELNYMEPTSCGVCREHFLV